MSNQQHTPGKWKAVPAKWEEDGERYGASCIETDDAVICTNVIVDEDACLIAAAPELLAALKQIRNIARTTDAEIYSIAFSAIAKVKGQS